MRNKLIRYSFLLLSAGFIFSNVYAMDILEVDVSSHGTTVIPNWTIEEKNNGKYYGVPYSKLLSAKSIEDSSFIKTLYVIQTNDDEKLQISVWRNTKLQDIPKTKPEIAYLFLTQLFHPDIARRCFSFYCQSKSNIIQKNIEIELCSIPTFHQKLKKLTYDVLSDQKVSHDFLSVLHKWKLIPDSLMDLSIKFITSNDTIKKAPSSQTHKQIISKFRPDSVMNHNMHISSDSKTNLTTQKKITTQKERMIFEQWALKHIGKQTPTLLKEVCDLISQMRLKLITKSLKSPKVEDLKDALKAAARTSLWNPADYPIKIGDAIFTIEDTEAISSNVDEVRKKIIDQAQKLSQFHFLYIRSNKISCVYLTDTNGLNLCLKFNLPEMGLDLDSLLYNKDEKGFYVNSPGSEFTSEFTYNPDFEFHLR